MTLAVASLALAQKTPKQRSITTDEKAAVLARISATLEKDAFVPGVDFSKWDQFIAAEKVKIDAAETQEQFTFAVNAAIQKFGFTHISLFPPVFAEARTNQRHAGIGVRVEVSPGKGLTVIYVFPNSPAERAGIHPGDFIFESDGKPIKDVPDLAGDKGQTSKIAFMRDKKRVELTITRDEYSMIVPETLTWDGDIATLKIPTFDIGYDPTNVDKLMKEAAKAKGVIVDLRGNGGGRVVNLLQLSSYFLDHDTQPLGTFLGRSTLRTFEQTHAATTDLKVIAEATTIKVRPMKNKLPIFNGPVSVLINEHSGSASEMFAAAIREQKSGKLFGSRSAGAVLASIMQPIDSGFLLQYPLLDYITIKGMRIEGTALIPDKAVVTPKYGEVDEASLLAKAWIKSVSSSRE